MHCDFPKFKNPRPVCPRSPATAQPSSGLAVAAALLQCVQLTASSLSATIQARPAGASNPPPTPEVRRLIGAARIPFCLNATREGVQCVRALVCSIAQRAIDSAGESGGPAAKWGGFASNRLLVGVMHTLLHLLALHSAYCLPNDTARSGADTTEAAAPASAWADANQVLSNFKMCVVSPAQADSPAASLLPILHAAQTSLEAGMGGEHLAQTILGNVQQRASAQDCASLVSLIPAALGFTPAASMPGAVSSLTGALMQMAVHSHHADNAELLPDPNKAMTASRVAWTALGAMLHDPLATRSLQPEHAQAAIDAIALGALVGMRDRTQWEARRQEAFGVATRAMELLSALNRAPVPCIAEAVALSAVVPELIAAVLAQDVGSLAGVALSARNAGIARAHKGALVLLYNMVFGAFCFHTLSPALPPVRAVKPVWGASVLQELGRLPQRGAALAFS